MRIAKRQRTAFTLVELLAVTVIIAILASLSTLAMNSSIQAAKEAKTRGTILKLDTAIQQIFESYEEKFEDISINNTNLTAFLGGSPTPDEIAKAEARIKLHYIRDLMRMEMPVTWTEIIDTTQNPAVLHGPIGLEQNGRTFAVDEPGVCAFYLDTYKKYRNVIDTTKVPSHAELLFLIILNLNPEALESFHESEIGDLDGNGLYEFHDAWGNPIMFLRWAPAFAGSDKQPDVITHSGYPLGTGGTNGQLWADGPSDVSDAGWNDPSTLSSPKNALVAAMQQAVSKHHDPFDQNFQTRSWFLYPVVFSAGADKLDDYYASGLTYSGNYTWTSTSQPILDPFELPNGLPNDGSAPDGSPRNGVLNHYDNIHNHRISGGF